MNAHQAWQAACGQLQMDMNKASYETWVRSAELVSFEGDVFTVGVPNAYARDWLESRLTGNVDPFVDRGDWARQVSVRFVVSSAQPEPEADSIVEAESDPEASEIVRPVVSQPNVILNTRYTFDNFVVGASNRLAHAASQAVAENPAKAYNPLFLYGGVGLGKTHLLHAIGNAAYRHGLTVLYVSSEEFTNDLINAIRSPQHAATSATTTAASTCC